LARGQPSVGKTVHPLALSPWWTVRRVVIVLALTACVAAAAFIWIFALRRRDRAA